MGAKLPSIRLIGGDFDCCDCGSKDGPFFLYNRKTRCIVCDSKRIEIEILASSVVLSVFLLLFLFASIFVGLSFL
jgi:hypothetical protein